MTNFVVADSENYSHGYQFRLYFLVYMIKLNILKELKTDLSWKCVNLSNKMPILVQYAAIFAQNNQSHDLPKAKN
jgi:hypothetical protein